jgi:hypothetical protein
MSDLKLEGAIDEKDMLIQILIGQRNAMLDQLTGLQLQVQKMTPYMPKEPTSDDKLQ